jgi:hypothetical protein
MAVKPKTSYREIEGEPNDSTDPNVHRYQPAEFGAWGKDAAVTQTAFHEYPKIPNSDEVFFSVRANSDEKPRLKETAKGLLQAAGFKDVYFKDAGSSDFAVSVKAKTTADFIRAVCAMATDAPKGAHDTHFALLDKSIAKDIVDMELARTKLTPTQAGLVDIKTEPMTQERLRAYAMNDQFSYTDVDLSKAAGFFPVVKMQEEGVPATAFSKNVFFVSTRLEVTHQTSHDVRQALENVGIKVKQGKDSTILNAAAPVDQVAEVLGKAGLLPQSLADEIKSGAEKGHINQRAINAEIEKRSPGAKKPVTAGPK